MLNMTIEAIIAIAAGFIILMNAYEIINTKFGKPKKQTEDRLRILEELDKKKQEEITEGKHERKIMCKGILACLKGLQEQGCNGPVTRGIAELEEHLLDSSHN